MPHSFLVALCLLFAASPVAAFDLQGHRSARGSAPENTLAAFAAALAVGVSTPELDVGVTLDGVLVVAHDQTLSPHVTPDAADLTALIAQGADGLITAYPDRALDVMAGAGLPMPPRY
jgi:glycerophosphoryl diester phosphodiesterase